MFKNVHKAIIFPFGDSNQVKLSDKTGSTPTSPRNTIVQLAHYYQRPMWIGLVKVYLRVMFVLKKIK